MASTGIEFYQNRIQWPMVKAGTKPSHEKTAPGQRPIICLGMPLYNQTKYLSEALNSLLAQTYSNFKLIISDDSTEPGPAQIVKSFSDQDHRIIYFRNEVRKGMVNNWRNCFHLSTDVDYFAWVGDHDVWQPDWLDTMVQVLDNNPNIVLVYPKTVNVDMQGNRRDKKPEKSLPLFSTLGLNDADRIKFVSQSGHGFGSMVYGLFRAEALRRAGVFRRVLYPDVILMLELSFQGDLHQVDAELWYRRRTARFSIARQKKTLFVQKPWYFFLPWPLVNACALFWNTTIRSGAETRTRRYLGFKLAWMYLLRWTRKFGNGSWLGSYHEWTTGQKPWMKKLKKRLRDKEVHS
jgi:glycosyltransferase involved in cell wall biosynthesis